MPPRDLPRRLFAFVLRRIATPSTPAARQPVHRVGVDDVDAACGNGREQCLHTGAVHRSRRFRCVCEADTSCQPSRMTSRRHIISCVSIDCTSCLSVEYRAYIAHRFIFPPFVLPAFATKVVMMVAYPISGRPASSGTSAAAPGRAPAEARGPARDRGAGRAAATASTPSEARGVTPTPTFPHSCPATPRSWHRSVCRRLFWWKAACPLSGGDRKKQPFVHQLVESMRQLSHSKACVRCAVKSASDSPRFGLKVIR